MIFSTDLQEEIRQKLMFKGKKEPSQRTCMVKIKFGTALLCEIAKNTSPESVKVAVEILKKLQIYLKDVKFPLLDKILLKMMNKGYYNELNEFVKNIDDPEIFAALCYVKMRILSVVDDKIFDIYHLISNEMKNKVNFLVKDMMNRDRTLKLNDASMQIIREAVKANSAINTENNCIQNATNKVCRCFYEVKTECSCQSTLFYQLFSGSRNWCEFNIIKLTDDLSDIYECIVLIRKSRLKELKTRLLALLKRKDNKMSGIIYNLLALVYFFQLEYYEAIYYLDTQLKEAIGFEREFSLHCKLLIDRYAELNGCYSILFVDTTSFECANLISIHFENKYMIRSLIGNRFERIGMFNDVFWDDITISNWLAKLHTDLKEYTCFFIFQDNEYLYIYNLSSKSHIKIYWLQYKETFEFIMAENQRILNMEIQSQEDKRKWWFGRINLDRQLGDLLESIRAKIELSAKERLVLVLEDDISSFPYEMLFEKPAFRVLSRDICNFSKVLDVDSAFYLLDPGNNLAGTRDCISKYFDTCSVPDGFVKGVVGRSLNNEEIQNLTNNELFLYFGHGTGKKYFQLPDSKPKLLFLFGCSSCKLLTVKNFKSNGYCLKHLKKHKIVLGNLWDVTDKDLDKLTVAILNDLFNGTCLIDSIHKNRNVCKLKYLNSAALVLYGVFSEIKCHLEEHKNSTSKL